MQNVVCTANPNIKRSKGVDGLLSLPNQGFVFERFDAQIEIEFRRVRLFVD